MNFRVNTCPPFSITTLLAVSLKSGGSIQLNLWDTAGQEDYDHIRALAYKDVDCFLVCFSVDSQSSFSNVKQKWIPSIIDSESKRCEYCSCWYETGFKER